MNTPIHVEHVDLYLSSDQATVKIFADISASLLAGHRYRVSGENGSGKTTFFHLLRQELLPQKGRVSLPEDCTFFAPDLAQIPHDIRVEAYINYLLAKHGSDGSATGILACFSLQHCARSLIGDLSLGEQQRVALLPILFTKASVLIFDEAFKYIDPPCRQRLASFIQQEFPDRTLLAVEHEIDDLFDYTDEIRLKGGALQLFPLKKVDETARPSAEVTTPKKGKVASFALRYAFFSRPASHLFAPLFLLLSLLLPLCLLHSSTAPGYYIPAVTLRSTEAISPGVREKLSRYHQFHFSLETQLFPDFYYRYRIDDRLSDDECRISGHYTGTSESEFELFPGSTSSPLDPGVMIVSGIGPMLKVLSHTNRSDEECFIFLSPTNYDRIFSADQFVQTFLLTSSDAVLDWSFFQKAPALDGRVYASGGSVLPGDSMVIYNAQEEKKWPNVLLYPAPEDDFPVTGNPTRFISYNYVQKLIADDRYMTVRFKDDTEFHRIRNLAQREGLQVVENYSFSKADQIENKTRILTLCITAGALIILSLLFLFFFGDKNTRRYERELESYRRLHLLLFSASTSLVVLASFFVALGFFGLAASWTLLLLALGLFAIAVGLSLYEVTHREQIQN